MGLEKLERKKVIHSTFGEGIVDTVEIDGLDTIINVRFNEEKSSRPFPLNSFLDDSIEFEDKNDEKIVSDYIDECNANVSMQAAQAAAAKPLKKLFEKDPNFEKYFDSSQKSSYKDIEKKHGIIRKHGRGIYSCPDSIILFSKIEKDAKDYIYHDIFDDNGDYIYVGEGKSGDQKMKGGNLAINEAKSKDRKILLYIEHLDSNSYYYQGEFELADIEYVDGYGEDGKPRKEYHFRLKK